MFLFQTIFCVTQVPLDRIAQYIHTAFTSIYDPKRQTDIHIDGHDDTM
jgi:hypothetical protein